MRRRRLDVGQAIDEALREQRSRDLQAACGHPTPLHSDFGTTCTSCGAWLSWYGVGARGLFR